jgi:tetratricopeptide (TPR) repeat protein
MRIPRKSVRVAAAALAIGALASVSSPVSAQINPGELRGTLVDENGQPVPNVTLLYSPAEGSAVAERKVKVNKKGSFAHAFFPSGIYKVELLDSEELFLKSMVYTLLDDGGLEIDQLQADAHPTDGLPSISVRPHRTVVLELVVAPREVQRKLALDVAVNESRGPLKEMSDLYAAGDYEAVVAQGDALLADKPEIGQAIYLRGVALWKLERLAEAHESLSEAVMRVPDQEGIYGVLGSVTVAYADEVAESGDDDHARELYVEAVVYFDKNLELNPGSHASLLSRAAALDKAGREAELEEALQAVIEADPTYLQAYFRLSSLYSKADRTEDALAVLARIPDADSSTATAIYNVAVKMYNSDDLDGAEVAARKAAEIDPGLAPIHRLLGRIYMSQGNTESAISAIETFLDLAPDDPQAGDERQLLEILKKAPS